jgi:transposase
MTQGISYVGIDVAKHRLDVRWGDEQFSVANDETGHSALLARLRASPLAAVGIEASGGYERRALKVLREAGLPVRVVDSWRLRQFAKACGRHAKTDPLDAAMIARFCQVMPAEAAVPSDPLRDKLERLVSYRQSLVADKVRLAHQIAQLDEDELIDMAQKRLQLSAHCLKQTDRHIRALIQSDRILKRKAQILQSAPGIGFVNAITLLAKLPELGQRGPKKIAALVGLAPYDDKSGRRDNGAHIARGRATPRAMLYLAVLSQLRRCPWAKAFRDNVTAQGKPKMVAVVALMRRLIVALNAMIKHDRIWFDPA